VPGRSGPTSRRSIKSNEARGQQHAPPGERRGAGIAAGHEGGPQLRCTKPGDLAGPAAVSEYHRAALIAIATADDTLADTHRSCHATRA
jgi:hypothetical protein